MKSTMKIQRLRKGRGYALPLPVLRLHPSTNFHEKWSFFGIFFCTIFYNVQKCPISQHKSRENQILHLALDPDQLWNLKGSVQTAVPTSQLDFAGDVLLQPTPQLWIVVEVVEVMLDPLAEDVENPVERRHAGVLPDSRHARLYAWKFRQISRHLFHFLSDSPEQRPWANKVLRWTFCWLAVNVYASLWSSNFFK